MQEVFTDAKRSLRCPTEARVISALGTELSVTEKASFHTWGLMSSVRLWGGPQWAPEDTAYVAPSLTPCSEIMGVVLGNKHKTLLHLCA